MVLHHSKNRDKILQAVSEGSAWWASPSSAEVSSSFALLAALATLAYFESCMLTKPTEYFHVLFHMPVIFLLSSLFILQLRVWTLEPEYSGL